jgi:hypothetical protein
VDIRKVDTHELRDIKKMRKYYYFNRPLYDAIVSDLDPVLGLNEPLYDFSDDEDEDNDANNEIKEG